MSGDPKRSSYRARKLGYYTKGLSTLGEAMKAQAAAVEGSTEALAKFNKSYEAQKGGKSSTTPKPSD